MEQCAHIGSKVDRVVTRLSWVNFGFGTGALTEAELFYNLGSVLDLAATELELSEQGALSNMVYKLLMLNPEFASIAQLWKLSERNCMERLLQRPVGYSATTRAHIGRMCVPIVNDSGTTCSCLTEECVVLLPNYTMKMLDGKHVSMDNYNYAIVQL